MKNLTALFLFTVFGLNVAQACPNLAGKYSGKGMTILMEQRGCDTLIQTVTIQGQSSRQVTQIDGQPHVTQNNKEMFNTYTANWNGDCVFLHGETQFRSGGVKQTSDALVYLDENGNLVDNESIVRDGQPINWTNVYQRVQ